MGQSNAAGEKAPYHPRGAHWLFGKGERKVRGPAGLTGEKAENQLEREENGDGKKKYLHTPNPQKPIHRLLIRVAGIREHARNEPKENSCPGYRSGCAQASLG